MPAYEEDGLTLFESGATVLHVAERSEALMPADPAARARVTAWLFAALNSVEPHLQHLALLDLFYVDEEWARLRRPRAEELAQGRLDCLADWLDGKEYLEAGRFTAADLLMTTVLRILRHTDMVTRMSVLDDYRQRCEARPAFSKALDAQMAPFAENAPAQTA